MSSKESTSKPKSVPLYRSKVKTKEDRKDCRQLFKQLAEFRDSIKSQYSISHNRSKILENIQGLLDYLRKQIKAEEKSIRQEIQFHENKLAELRAKLYMKVTLPDTSWETVINELIEPEQFLGCSESLQDYIEEF